MIHSKYKYIPSFYWLSTVPLVLWMYTGAFGALTKNEMMMITLKALEYPNYFHFPLGLAKLIGATLILLPINRYLRFISYIGVFYELTFASFSYAITGHDFPEPLLPLIFLVITGISYYTWIKKNDLVFTHRLPLPIKVMKGFKPELVADKKFVSLYRTFKIKSSDILPWKLFKKTIYRDEQKEIFLIDLNGELLGITVWDLAYHHIAQGTFNNLDFLITFCPVCNSGRVLNPILDGQKLDFYVSGVYRGMMIMSDRQSNSYWDHITGECLYGFYGGRQLEELSSHKMTLAKKAPEELYIAMSRLSIWQKLVRVMQNGHTWRKVPEGKFYPGFKESFEFEDHRRPEKELGLGVWVTGEARFYPLPIVKSKLRIEDTLGREEIIVKLDPVLSIPEASFKNNQNVRPQQVFMRWYGFVQTFKEVTVYMTS